MLQKGCFHGLTGLGTMLIFPANFILMGLITRDMGSHPESGRPSESSTMEERRDNVSFMLKKFKWERFAYLIITILSFIGLAYCMFIFVRSTLQTPNGFDKEAFGYIAGMFGTGGIIGVTAARLLRMWTDCLQIITGLKK